MPFSLVLHERDAPAFNRVSNDDGGSEMGVAKTVHPKRKIQDIVTIHLDDIPPKGPPLVCQRFEGLDTLRIAVYLQPVAVDDTAEIIQPIMSGSHSRFPDLSFIEFTIAHNAKNLIESAIHFLGKSDAGSDGKALPKASRGGFETGEFAHIGMALKTGAQLP